MNIESSEFNDNLVTAAKAYLKMGYTPIVLKPRSKAPSVKWGPFQAKPPPERLLKEWFGKSKECPNIGLLTGNGAVVVDVDDRALVDAVITHAGDTPMRCRS